MNTIPTTFNENLSSYTAVGGRERGASTGLSAVVLSRAQRYPRYELFEELGKTGFDYVISMESSHSRYDFEELSESFPFVRFILLKDPVSPGEEINMAAAELSSPLFFVLWNDLKILRGGCAERMAERLLSGNPESRSRYKRLCTVPVIQDGRSETIPTVIVPALFPEKKQPAALRTMPFLSEKEGLRTLYPFDGIGIYERERFVRLGGFDPSIKNFHWQLMDFGFRAALWGEEIAATRLIKLSYEKDVPREDGTTGESYRRFFLKNLLPVFRGDYAHLPLGRFPSYYKRSGDLFSSWEEFRAARAWVRTNRYRFVSDARIMAELWESPDASGGESSCDASCADADSGGSVDAADSKDELSQKDKLSQRDSR